MKEQWMVEAEQNAKDLAEILYAQITDEADDICVDRKWYFEKVVQYMRTENEEKQESILDKIRAELIQSIQNGTLKIESGNEELFRIFDKYEEESKE